MKYRLLVEKMREVETVIYIVVQQTFPEYNTRVFLEGANAAKPLFVLFIMTNINTREWNNSEDKKKDIV